MPKDRRYSLFQRCFRQKSESYLMRITALAVVLSCGCALFPATAVSDNTGIGPPPALASGEAPPLVKQGPLAQPRSSDQVGFPKVLTQYVFSPTSLRPARVALGQKLFFEFSALR